MNYIYIDPDLENKIRGKGYIIRLYCDVMFRTQNGWTEPYTAIVDSGAHISVIPRRIWSKSKVNIITEYKMTGLVPLEECTVPVRVGELDLLLIDKNKNIKEIDKVLCYFALTDEIPLLLGFKTLFEYLEVYYNYPEGKAFIKLL